jgi:hypothetical protein
MFDNPSEVDSICYQMRMADFVRGANRARINGLFNGVPPYTDQEVETNKINVNVNYLEALRIGHDARAQFTQAYMKPGVFFNCKTDFGAIHKRDSRARNVTKEMNKVMKRSLPYFECNRSKFASNTLHGIAPAAFRDSQRWCPQMMGVEDVFIPCNTLLTMENLPLFAFFRTFTGPELKRLAKGPSPDSAWSQSMVNGLLKWIDETTPSLFSTNWPELWSPEKAGERIKGDGGLYSGDAVPVVNVWDFYFWDDAGKEAGWKRRMIVDAWTSPDAQNGSMTRRKGGVFDTSARTFLYNPKNRIYGRSLHEIVNFQFADLSAVAPFKYHTVRSLGFMMYSICHLQNRLRCKFSEAVLESLMQYFRVKSADDVQRVLKAELVSNGFIDDGIQFIPQSERWQVNEQLAQLGLQENAALINKNSSSYTTNPFGSDRPERTKFEVMAEVNAMSGLVSAGLQQSYAYQAFEYREIFRRFMIKDSRDPEVRSFQAACLTKGVPIEMFNADCWEIEPERVTGAGNKTLELAIAQQLLEMRHLFDPEPQRMILRDATSAITDDPAKADMYVPEQPHISDSTHDAQISVASLMMGLPVAAKSGINHTEFIEALLTDMAVIIKQIQSTGNVGTPDKVIGLKNIGNHITQHMEMLAQDKEMVSRVKQYGDQLGKMMNLIKGFEQRIMEKQKKAQEQNGGDPEAMAKIQAMMMQAQAKTENTRDAHAQRTAQRQLQFEMEQERKRAEFEARMGQESAQFQLELKAKAASSRIELEHDVRKSDHDIKTAEKKAKAEKSGPAK